MLLPVWICMPDGGVKEISQFENDLKVFDDVEEVGWRKVKSSEADTLSWSLKSKLVVLLLDINDYLELSHTTNALIILKNA